MEEQAHKNGGATHRNGPIEMVLIATHPKNINVIHPGGSLIMLFCHLSHNRDMNSLPCHYSVKLSKSTYVGDNGIKSWKLIWLFCVGVIIKQY
jgi:hypothetical protein